MPVMTSNDTARLPPQKPAERVDDRDCERMLGKNDQSGAVRPRGRAGARTGQGGYVNDCVRIPAVHAESPGLLNEYRRGG